ncbi:MAG: metallophosphoesterase [Deltaproteobacteria bacterium]|nr:metallophosphoesterase [Deltaproteobacteria bacterium]
MSALAVGRTLFPIALIAITLLLASNLLRVGFPGAWQRWVKRAVGGVVGVAVVGFVAWEILRIAMPHSWPSGVAMTVTTSVFASSIALALTAVLWGPMAIATRAPRVVDTRRRAFLRSATGSLPMMAAATGPVGAVAASVKPALTEVEIRSRSIPPALDGLTILQLTDVHLGVFIHEDQFQAVVDVVTACGVVPDLVVLTGDICDDFTQLPGALQKLAALAPPLGTFASIGNHEIYRGRHKAERIYGEHGVGFLCDNGVVLEKNGAKLWLGGADDPARGLDGPAGFLTRTVDRAIADCPDDVTCKVLLSHRPTGFLRARERGVTLTLSGHTHGAQMAAFGRSLLENLWPESFLLGHYEHGEGQCHLYTSAGLGHWMPFRLNCPTEVVLVTLRTDTSAPPAT